MLLADLPPAKRLLGNKGYDADWLRDELKARGLRICIPARRKRKHLAPHNRRLYKKHCRIENAFAWLKDWRGIATRYTRCGDLFLSALFLAATVLFWLKKSPDLKAIGVLFKERSVVSLTTRVDILLFAVKSSASSLLLARCLAVLLGAQSSDQLVSSCLD